ncbi:hypothetical protein LPTSP4_18770 [Leptospira ryugenii]|uniref:DUF1761 domain-containing protein n=1 Tax=Leptospira ryugenii TaxID=1917863 RepID=A0A2P2E0E4_9LEPT|nr:hypothetical protein [Leptospira ryugenii]GBF50352.1 hypothetical protein LPTSP4_18770 [Leptospira ryugenii]
MKTNLLFGILTFLAVAILETIINQILLSPIYGSLSALWRQTEELKANASIFFGIYGVFSFSYVWLFLKSYQGKGWLEGAMIGLALGGIAKFWYGYTNYIVLPIPHSLGFLWFVYGTVELLLIGIFSAAFIDRTKHNPGK